jgi:hypothetical protein
VKNMLSFGVGIWIYNGRSRQACRFCEHKNPVPMCSLLEFWTLPSAARGTPKTDQVEKLEARHESYRPAAVYLRDSSDKSDGEPGYRPPG